MSAPQSAGVSPAHTSVPRCTARTAAALPVDPLAAGYVVVATAPEARSAARQFAARLPMPAIMVDAFPGTAPGARPGEETEGDAAADTSRGRRPGVDAGRGPGVDAGRGLDRDTGRGLSRLTDVLATVRVGWRFAVIGPEPMRSRSRAAILAAGAIDAEIVTAALGFGSRAVPGGPAEDVVGAVLGVPARYGSAHETGDDLREVFCAHCRTVTVADVPVGGETGCAGCGHRLAVYHHFSRRLHAYLGYRPDAEELR